MIEREEEKNVWKEVGRKKGKLVMAGESSELHESEEKEDNVQQGGENGEGPETHQQETGLAQDTNKTMRIEEEGEDNSMETYLKLVEQVEEGEFRKGGSSSVPEVNFCVVEEYDCDKEEGAVVCRNSFAVLSEDEVEIVKETQKDYCSNPGTIPQTDLGIQNSDNALVRKSRRAKANQKN